MERARESYDTRKTTPGWRRLEKYAVHRGGGRNHRTGLFDAILIKDIIWRSGQQANSTQQAAGSRESAERFTPAEAVRRAKQFIARNFPEGDRARSMLVEVEVDSLEDLKKVLHEQPDIVLLDNMTPNTLRDGVKIRNSLAPGVELEASGGISLSTVRAVAESGVERISSGAADALGNLVRCGPRLGDVTQRFHLMHAGIAARWTPAHHPFILEFCRH